ncbi:hydroxycinnamoyltransferase-like [Cryptomeria japonica]|uniref:hydroxycinnamoyltransferase-like n=1 Tax=Cryptomeria japonica TaxID=3369 RepID=UPI0027DA5042|nr:hydroxycinnamoyltransferase-like [Cryptomeria japonica]
MEEAQAQVKVHRISSVVPAIPTERHPMFLSNLDLFWLPINNVQRILFYTISPENQYFSIVESLKKSLSSVLVYFYPLAGRLDKGESVRLEIDCNDSGVEFVEASIDMPFSFLERDGFQYKPLFQNLVPKAHPLQDHSCPRPILSVQVTCFQGEGVSIGTTLHHVIADGNSFWNFMKSWAEAEQDNTRSIEESQKYVQKWLARKTEVTEVVYSTFCFTEENIRALKKQSGAVSSFIAMAAHFWRSVMIAREV